MSKQEKPSAVQKIEPKWVREHDRTFSEFPGVPRTFIPGEEDIWLEILHFYRDDLKWLLSLDHHKFWSYMIYSRKAQDFLISFLKRFPPNCLRDYFLLKEELKNVLSEIEHLVFLTFLRLSTERESENCYVRNFGDVIYNHYIFTVPIILDICVIYGTSNQELVREMIKTVVTSAPNFLDDFQEIIPHFFYVLKTVKEKFLENGKSEGKKQLTVDEIEDLVIYVTESAATIQIFFELYPDVCQLFSKTDVITEIVSFYSNVLIEMSKSCEPFSFASDLIENVRIDLLKIVKSIFDFILTDTEGIPEKKDLINEYLALVKELLAGPVFLSDYNLMYSLEFEIECAVRNFQNVNLAEVNSVLEKIASVLDISEGTLKENVVHEDSDVSGVTVNSLVTEVKDLLPHLEENFIRQCLSYYNNDAERVIAAVLENRIPPDLNESTKKLQQPEEVLEFTGKHKNMYKDFNEMLNDKSELKKIKDEYAELSLIEDDAYDDEYDDTYDEHSGITIGESDEAIRRPFTTPRVLRTGYEEEEEEEEEEGEEEKEEAGEEEEEDMEGMSEDNCRRDNFVENPVFLREKMEQARLNKRNVTGRAKRNGQSNEVLKNRNFKESHKSFIANHNRKKQASRKMARGMVPS